MTQPYIVKDDLPDSPDTKIVLPSYITRFREAILRALSYKVDTRNPVSRILLASPDGTVYSVSVSDNGTLSATKVRQ